MKKIAITFLLLTLGLLWASSAFAALADYDNYTNTSRIDWAQSNNDYVWFGTFGGLKRYNKQTATWTIFTTSDNLNDNWVYTMLADRDKLWLGTFSGLDYQDTATGAITKVADVDVDNEVITCMENAGTILFAATYAGGGLTRSADDGVNWVSVHGEGFNDLCWDGDSLWGGSFTIASGAGTGLKWSDPAATTWTQIAVLGDTDVYSVENFTHDTIVIGTWGGGVWISSDSGVTWSQSGTGDGLGSNFIWDVAVSPDGLTFWAACADNNATGGVSKSTDGGQTWTNSTFVNGYNNAFTVWLDGNRVWAGTVGGGISVSVDQGANWTTYTAINGIGDVQPDRAGVAWNLQGVVNAYDVDVYNSVIWTACTPGGVSKSTDNGASWTTYTPLSTAGGIPDTSAHAVAVSADAVWIGTAGGAARSTNSGNNWTTYTRANTGNGLASDDVRCIVTRGDTTYFGCAFNTVQPGGFSKYNATNGWTHYDLAAYHADCDTVNGISIVDNTIWIATNNGILRSQNDGDTWDLFTAGMPGTVFWDVAATMDTVWVAGPGGGAGGVAKSNPPYTAWTVYGAAAGLGDNSNYCLRINGDWVWVGSSNNGGMSYSRDDGLTWTNAKVADGLVENYVYGIDIDGNYAYFAAKNGITRFDYKYPEATITSPAHGEILSTGIEAITGSAIDYGNIASWDIFYASGAFPNQGAWTQIGASGAANVSESLLQAWNVSQLSAGDYTLRLRSIDGIPNTNTQYIVVNIPITGAVTFTAPNAGEEVGGIIDVTCIASDSDGVANVGWQYSIDSTNGVNGSWNDCVADSGSNPDSFSTYTFRWQTLPASGIF